MKINKMNLSYKKMIVVTLLVALCGVGFAGTYALFSQKTDDVKNEFKVGEVNVAVVENNKEHEDSLTNEEIYMRIDKAGSESDKVVEIKNKGIDAYIRVTLEANIVSDKKDENVILLEEANVEYTFASGTNWKVDKDGTYYYTKALKKDQLSDVLIQKVKILNDIPEGFHLEVKVLTDAISAKPNSNLKEAWSITDFSHLDTVK